MISDLVEWYPKRSIGKEISENWEIVQESFRDERSGVSIFISLFVFLSVRCFR